MAGLSYWTRLAAAAYVLQVYGINTTMSVGPSMLPTFNVRGDILITEYVSPRVGKIRAGDVVVATKPTDPRVNVLKRVRGVAGEKIWVQPKAAMHAIRLTVPEGHVWLEGDNAAQSTDSREYGPVPKALVRGKVIARCWPPSQACIVRNRVVDHTAEQRSRAAWPGIVAAEASKER